MSDVLSHDLASSERDIAISQARQEVLIDAAVLAGLVAAAAVTGARRNVLWRLAPIAAGVMVTARDVKWWMWLRQASPYEAMRRLQEAPRTEELPRPGVAVRLAFGAAVLVWWYLSRS